MQKLKKHFPKFGYSLHQIGERIYNSKTKLRAGAVAPQEFEDLPNHEFNFATIKLIFVS